MIEDRDIEKLAALSRIELSPAERESLRADIEAILTYIGEIEKVPAGSASGVPPYSGLLNVMREDVNPTPAGTYTERLLREVPKRQGDYVKVKQVLTQR